MLTLRRIDERMTRLNAAARAWRARGWQASLEHMPRMGSWMQVQDCAHTWQGWVEPGMWLEGVAHELASLACSAESEQLAARLFAVSANPLHLPMPELRYDGLDVGAPVEGAALPEAMLLKVHAAECPVWLARVPDVKCNVPLDLRGVPFRIDVELGRSRARLATLRGVRRGDVLIVRDVQRRLSCAGKVIGTYQREEGNAMLETYLHDDIDDSDDIDDMTPDDEPAYDADERGEGMAGMAGMAPHEGRDRQPSSAATLPFEQLPVELVFVLQRERMTLAELQRLGDTRVMALHAGAEQRVEVRVNDTLLARGELVQLDGRLGVEVSEWLMESKGERGPRGPDHVD
ncbi:hypothetical protein AB870_12280 [Pandoraea faecigallinarum]|uniref:Uncharacterized protein n=1 Tax=Pandoraea faecigallinarum TaxID=656179 RepID=A0A0H3WRB0_9BURK|nr:type III secretion system cytoplasmic ring protein SctQ [Pandoraea faecigallinarum]AKM30719.1 hypothetical protein AB870_12280 [Pandoraea faecigallinarum]